MNKKVLSIISMLALSMSLIAVLVSSKTAVSSSASSDISPKLIAGGTMPAGNYTLSRGVTITKDIVTSGVEGGLVTVENCTASNNKGGGFLRNHNKVTPVPAR